MFTQSINFSIYSIVSQLKSIDVWKMWFIKWKEMNCCFFQHFSKVYGKIWETLFLKGFILKPTERAYRFYLLKDENLFQKTGRFLVESTKIKIFLYKIALSACVIQIAWDVQNGSITKNGVLPVTTFFFRKFCFSLKTLYKELTWCTNYPNVHIHTFRKRSSFIWECFFPVSILKSI